MSRARLVASSAATLAVCGALAGGAASAAPPTVALVQQPPATTPATAATFAWTSQGAAATTCALDSRPPAFACTSPTTLTGLSVGAHTFAVRVANASGSMHALATWTITPTSSAPPSVTILSGPGRTTSSTSATFAFSAANASALACSVDAGAPAPCTSPVSYTGIAPGSHTFVVTATSGSLSTSAAYTWTVGGPTANIWIDPAGSDSGIACTRSASPTGEPSPSTVCATPQRACMLARGGDVVGVAAGTYAVGFNLTSCNPALPVTFENVPGTFVSFAPTSTIADSSNITLQGDAVGHGVGFSLAYTTVGGSSSNIVWNDVNLYCEARPPYVVIHSNQTNETACNSALSLTGTVNGFTWNGGDQEDWAVCLTACTHTGTIGNPNDDFIHPHVRNVLIEHVVFRNYYALDSSGIHSEEWFLDGGDDVEFLDDRITDCGPPASTGYAVNASCNTAVVFVGQLSGTDVTTNHLSFIQDVIAGGHPGQKAFQSAYDHPAGTEPTFTFEYDTLDGSLTVCGVATNPCGPGIRSTLTGRNMTFVGNVGILSSVGCFASSTYSHDIWYSPVGYAGRCSSSDSSFSRTANTTFWAAPGVATFDYAPLGPIQSAGENISCPATDISGTPRPASTPCDAGAVQH